MPGRGVRVLPDDEHPHVGQRVGERAQHPIPGPVALLAVGGYGRGTLGLGSDLDVILVAESVDAPAVHKLAETLVAIEGAEATLSLPDTDSPDLTAMLAKAAAGKAASNSGIGTCNPSTSPNRIETAL